VVVAVHAAVDEVVLIVVDAVVVEEVRNDFVVLEYRVKGCLENMTDLPLSLSLFRRKQGEAANVDEDEDADSNLVIQTNLDQLLLQK
jgi:hypothetical protein